MCEYVLCHLEYSIIWMLVTKYWVLHIYIYECSNSPDSLNFSNSCSMRSSMIESNVVSLSAFAYKAFDTFWRALTVSCAILLLSILAAQLVRRCPFWVSFACGQCLLCTSLCMLHHYAALAYASVFLRCHVFRIFLCHFNKLLFATFVLTFFCLRSGPFRILFSSYFF